MKVGWSERGCRTGERNVMSSKEHCRGNNDKVKKGDGDSEVQGLGVMRYPTPRTWLRGFVVRANAMAMFGGIKFVSKFGTSPKTERRPLFRCVRLVAPGFSPALSPDVPFK